MARIPSGPNLADVAGRAGVSMATASRALNNAYGVSASTRGRVLAVAEELSYVVSPEASRLAGGRTHRVAVLVPHLSRWFFGEMLAGIESVAQSDGLDILLYSVPTGELRREFFERLPVRRKVDAVVVVAFPITDDERARLDEMGVIIVAAGGQNADYPFVCIDDMAAGRRAVAHLLALGHRRIAMIAAETPLVRGWPAVNLRSAAYYAELEEAGVRVDPNLVRTVDWGGEQAADAMVEVLSAPTLPTAVFAHSDEVALGAMRSIRRAGLRIPEDISVVGIDDHPLASLSDLTTVRQGVREQGAAAGRILLALLAGRAVDAALTMPTSLIVRRSTAPPAADGNPGAT